MPIITRLDKIQGMHPCVRIYLDGHFAFSLEPETATCLEKDQFISDAELENLVRASESEHALATALRLLERRPHSRLEMEQKLIRRQFSEVAVARTIDHLTARRLLDDGEFARAWCENRDAFRPRSRSFIKAELREKGVAPEDIQVATMGMDDEASALQAGEKRVRVLAHVDYNTFYRRLGDYLRRRGYNYEVIKITVNKLWQARE